MPNLTVYDPTPDLLGVKEKEGLLYWRTDTHWNQKGAFWAYAGLAKTLNLPVPKLEFRQGDVYSGDLVKISRLKNFPLHADDNWQAVWNAPITWTQTKTATVVETEFGPESVVTNVQPLSEKTVWVIGDSFCWELKT